MTTLRTRPPSSRISILPNLVLRNFGSRADIQGRFSAWKAPARAVVDRVGRDVPAPRNVVAAAINLMVHL